MSPSSKHLPYMPGLDGLRAIAVLAVFVYHFHNGGGWLPGGFLGVDVFFVISGYLITSLLLSEFRKEGRVDLVAFWLRRARRLLPAVGVLIAVVMVAGAFFDFGQISTLRGQALASMAYVTNWDLILSHQSYFQEFAPSLAVPPPLVAGSRGAVLSALAARLRRLHDAASGTGAWWSA